MEVYVYGIYYQYFDIEGHILVWVEQKKCFFSNKNVIYV